MTPDHEAAVRAALDGLAAALLTALRAEVGSVPPTPDRLLSITAAAAALGIGRTAVYAELMSGHLQSLKVGRRRLIPASAIATYIEARSPGTTRKAR